MFIVNWLKKFFKNTEVRVEAKVQAPSPWPFPVVTGTPPAEKKPTVKKATTRIVKDTALKSMREKPAPVKNKTAAKAATKRKKAAK